MCGIVFQGDGAEAGIGTSQSVGATSMLSQPQSQETSPVPHLSYTALPTQQHAAGRAVDSSSLSSPDVLERCVVLSDLSSCESPVGNGSCVTPHTINSVTPPGDSSCSKLSASENVTDEQGTPLSVRSGRKRKRQKRRLHRSTLPPNCSDPVISTSSCGGTAVTRIEECSGNVAVKMEPTMPKLMPEPRVEYNPETPLRISIHLPLNGVIDAAEGGLLNKNVGRSAAVLCSNDSRKICSAGVTANSAMPVDLTSRASVQMLSSSSTSSAADVKHYSSVSSVSSSVPSPRPVYSPISSISGRSTPDAENENVGSSRQEVPQPQQSVGIIASFLDRFNGMSAESLEFSPSQSIWTRSFAEQLAAVSRDSFLAAHNLAAPLLSPVADTDRHMTEADCQVNVNNSDQLAGHSSLVSVSNSAMNSRPCDSIRHNTKSQDYAAVRPTMAADTGLNGVFNVDLLNVDRHSNCEVDTKVPLLSNSELYSSTEAVSMNGIVSSENDTLPGMTF